MARLLAGEARGILRVLEICSLFLSGEWEIEASEGTLRHFGPPSVLLVEDTFGKGHTSVISESDSLALLVQLGD